MSILLSEILTLSGLDGIRVRAGFQGLNRSVSWVNVLELLDELDKLRPGELFVTTAVGLAENTELQSKIIQQLSDKGLAGLAIQTGYYLEEIPEVLIQWCDELDFPLLEIPREVSFGEMTRMVSRRIIQRQSMLLERTQQIQQGMTNLLLANQGLCGIANQLSYLLDAPVRILDSRFYLLASSGIENGSAWLDSETLALERERILTFLRHSQQSIPVLFEGTLFYPLWIGPVYYGCISVLSSSLKDEQGESALISAGTISLLEIMKQQAVWEAEERIRGDFLDDLLEGSWAHPDDIQNRGRRLGYDLEQPFTVWVLGLESTEEASEEEKEIILNRRKDIAAWLRIALEEERYKGVIRELRNQLILFLPLTGNQTNEDVVELAQRCHGLLYKRLESSVSIGLGRIYIGIVHLAHSLQEARSALQLGESLNRVGEVISHEELGVYKLLGATADTDEIARYYASTVEVLAQYDAKHGSELVYTLETFFRANLEIRETSRRLFIHRHTLSYRLKRIQDISGLDPLHDEDRFQLQLGLRIAPLLQKVPMRLSEKKNASNKKAKNESAFSGQDSITEKE